MQFLVGADPELFLRDPKTGVFISGHNALPGTKQKPFPVKSGAVQIDGTALEFNIDPAKSCDEFVSNIADVMKEMQAMAGQFGTIVAEPVAEYDEPYFKTIPEFALELGCTPDFNAWTGEQNPVPDADVLFRTGSGHVHIGWGNGFDIESPEHRTTCMMAVRQLDYYLGLATLLWDPDNRRRELYGKAGAYRPKAYGFEYRVASNAWLRSEALQRFVYDAVIKGMTDLVNGNDKGAQFGDKARTLIDGNVSNWREKFDFETGLDYSRIAA